MAKSKRPSERTHSQKGHGTAEHSEIRSIYDRGSASSAKPRSSAVSNHKRGPFTPAGNYSIEEFPALKQLFDAYER
jgi:hypothetical protein